MHPAVIGPYKIQRELGRGGMGEVFLATDSRLDRHVAIKALPAHLAQDADRLARFQREARILASLNHPGIGAIYGLEEAGGLHYLVLEFIAGTTLAARLAPGALPLEEALATARHIAEALEAAHEKGIVHRDLKPGNVMVTPDGVVKVLDFGLAGTAEGAHPSSSAAAPVSPTVTSPAPVPSPTIPGVIMGTAGYMSPEQARGKPVDRRSDIFSFGCVLYEMLTGAQPFVGETATDSMGATLHRDPDWSLLPATTPRRVRDLLTVCLAKDRKQRLHDIADARIALQRATDEPSEAAAAPAAARRAWAVVLPWTLVAAMALVGGAFPLWSSGLAGVAAPTAAPGPVVRFTIEPPKGHTLPPFTKAGSNIAISPAGDRIVFVAEADNKPHLCVRDVAAGQARVLPNTEHGSNPFFSPDGNWLGFVVKDRLMKMPADGGPALSICEVTNFASFEWLDDGTIAWGASQAGVWRVNADGGTPLQLAKAGPDTVAPEGSKPALGFDVPVRVPGADYILCNSWDGPTTESFNLLAISLQDGRMRTVLRAATEPRLLAPDVLLFMRGTTAMTMRFDTARGVVLGEPKVALEGIRTDQWQDSAYIGASRSGTFAYVPGKRFGSGKRLVRVDETGKVTPVMETTDNYSSVPIASPDGRRVVFTTLRSKLETWVLDLERGSMALLSSAGEQYAPMWSRDGTSIVAQLIAADGTLSLHRWPATGGDPTLLAGTSATFIEPLQELPDGSALLVMTKGSGLDSKSDIALYDHAKASLTPVRRRAANEGNASITPDGSWLAYASDESGRSEVYLGPLGAAGPNVQVSTQGGLVPRLSRDGKRVFYIDDKGVLLAATIEMRGTTPVASAPTRLFDCQSLNLQPEVGFDVLPDGRFLMIERAAWQTEPPVLHVILNWTEELRARSSR